MMGKIEYVEPDLFSLAMEIYELSRADVDKPHPVPVILFPKPRKN